MTTATKLKWIDIPITIAAQKATGEDVYISKPGKEAVGTGLGYVINDLEEDDPDDMLPTYIITHIASGRRIIQDDIVIEEEAKRIVSAIAPVTNWDRSMDDLVADPHVHQNTLDKYRQARKKYWELIADSDDWGYWDH